MKAALTMSANEFCHAVKTNRVFRDLPQRFRSATGRTVGPAEQASWQGSLPRLSGAIELAGLPENTCISLEVQIPYYSERIDAVLYGHSGSERACAVLVELKNGKRGKEGVPEAKHWAIDPAGADQVGTVYSVQGFEFRNLGVLMGPDLVSRGGRWVANPRENFRNSIRAKAEDVASVYPRRIYRALFTRPLRALRVFSVDEETRRFLRGQVEQRVVSASRARPALADVRILPFRRLGGETPQPGEIAVQLHRLTLAAGRPGHFQYEQVPEWVVPIGARKAAAGMVMVQIDGDSMVPLALPGQYALFAPVVAGEDGMVVLAQIRKRHESRDGGRYVLKVLRVSADRQLTLESLNRAHESIRLGADEELRVVARWVESLGGAETEGDA